MEGTQVKKALITNYLQMHPASAAMALNELGEKEVITYLASTPADTAASIYSKLDRNLAANILEDIDDDIFVQLFSIIDPFKSAIILSMVDEDLGKAKLSLLPESVSKEISELMSYPSESAGFLMDTKITTFFPEITVKQTLKKLRLIKERKLTDVYIIDQEGVFLGKVSLQDIAISSPREPLKNLVEKSIQVHVMSPYDEIVDLMKYNKTVGLPVVDIDNRLLGIIRSEVLFQTAQQEAIENVQTIFGAGREERALSKVSFAVRKRLPWLEINLATAFLAAAVVGLFEDTIARITVLAVFLPVVAGQSGNTGSQALAVTMRGLALREIRPAQWWKVARKESMVGLVNGVVVAFTTSIIVYFWASSFGLAIIIGVSMIASMIIAGFSGAVIPIFLKSVGQDPAQSSSIVLTTVTDIVGFMSFLGLATALGAMLGVI